MSPRLRFVFVSAALVAALAACSSKRGAAGNGAPSASAIAVGPLATAAPHSAKAPEFPSLDPSLWVNGAPVSFASLHNHVVLVEAWHRL